MTEQEHSKPKRRPGRPKVVVNDDEVCQLVLEGLSDKQIAQRILAHAGTRTIRPSRGTVRRRIEQLAREGRIPEPIWIVNRKGKRSSLTTTS